MSISIPAPFQYLSDICLNEWGVSIYTIWLNFSGKRYFFYHQFVIIEIQIYLAHIYIYTSQLLLVGNYYNGSCTIFYPNPTNFGSACVGMQLLRIIKQLYRTHRQISFRTQQKSSSENWKKNWRITNYHLKRHFPICTRNHCQIILQNVFKKRTTAKTEQRRGLSSQMQTVEANRSIKAAQTVCLMMLATDLVYNWEGRNPFHPRHRQEWLPAKLRAHLSVTCKST